jgi:hypothetical protein
VGGEHRLQMAVDRVGQDDSLEAWPLAAGSGSGCQDGVGQLVLDRLEVDHLFE